jgi:pimeloyl-ACP methyl ester carboxylesterase
MALIGETFPHWLVSIIWMLGGVALAVRKLLTMIPVVNELVFWLYAPRLSADELNDPVVHRAAMLEIERQFTKQHLDFPVEHEFVAVESDVHLHVVHAGDKKKPLMLFLHGFPEFYFSWRHLLREFSKDFHCVAVDQRGYSISSKPRKFTDYCIKNLVTDVETLVGKLGYADCVLVAHDWGGNVAWHVAHATNVVNRLVMFNMPHPSIFVKALRASSIQRKLSLYILFFQLPFTPDAALARGNGRGVANLILSDLKTAKRETRDADAFARAANQPGAVTAALNWYRAALNSSPARKWLRKQIEVPVLYVNGMDDVAFDSPFMLKKEGFDKYCANVKIVPLSNCSHWTANDRPDKCIEEMRKWL